MNKPEIKHLMFGYEFGLYYYENYGFKKIHFLNVISVHTGMEHNCRPDDAPLFEPLLFL